MIHGTTINLYSVGHRRLALCFAFALVFSSFGQSDYPWQESDVTYIRSKLDSIDSSIYSNGIELNSIGSDVAGLEIILDEISHDTGDILSRLNNLVFTRNHELLVSDTGLVHVASSIDTKMDRLEQAINNLTNFLCYSSEFTSTFNSNIAFLATSFFGGCWPPYGIERQLNDMIDLVEFGDYDDMWIDYGLWRAFPAMLFSIINSDGIPPEYYQNLKIVYSTIFDKAANSYDTYKIYYDSISKPISYQYGTRPLTETAIGISNFLVTANQTGITDLDGSISSHTVYDSTGQASHSTTSLFGRVSGQLGKTFGIYGEPAETNDVKQIDSPQLSSQQSTIIADNVQYSINDGCQQVNSTVSGVVDSIFEGRNTSGAFVIPGFSINGYNAGLDDVVIDPADYNLSHAGLRWFFNAVRALCLVGFVISSLWRIISVESKLNAPDPF